VRGGERGREREKGERQREGETGREGERGTDIERDREIEGGRGGEREVVIRWPVGRGRHQPHRVRGASLPLKRQRRGSYKRASNCIQTMRSSVACNFRIRLCTWRSC